MSRYRSRAAAWLAAFLVTVLTASGLAATGVTASIAAVAAAATSPTLNLKILLIGNGSADVTTAAWEAALKSEGVAYDEVTATGTSPNQAVTLPTLSSGTTGNYNGIVIADSPTEFASGALSALDTYESTFGVRQVDGYMYPDPALGVTEVTGGALDGTTGTLTTAGLAAFPELKGPIPFDTGSYGYTGMVTAGAPYTSFLNNSAGDTMAGVYQHPSTDPQAGVSELALNFDYNASQEQWLLLAPGLINWVTNDTHLGLYRNYFGQDIDDLFIADNEWSSQFQCTPAATEPPDYNCPVADQGVAPGSATGVPADVQMSATDVAYVVAWEKQTGITLNLAFNAVGACTTASNANCTGSVTENGATYTDPGVVADPSAPNDTAFVNALLANQGSFNWMTHTWSHLFLGCTVWQPQVLTSATASGTGGTFTAGGYNYEITAATAYGESEPSTAQSVTVGTNGSVSLTWPEATNGTGTAGNAGQTLAQEEASHTGGSGFWGYNVYREDPGATTYGLVGQVPENTASTASTTYSFTDTGTAAGEAPNSGPGFPTATNPGIDCSTAAGSWLPATSTTADSSIEQEIGLDQAFAAANKLTNYSPAVVVTGEHSGIENPNMPAALAGVGVTTFAQDASRQPQQYSLGAALGAPRYPSNIYYNADNFTDELNEYNSLYVAQGDSLGSTQFPSETGHCTDTSATTCRTTPATEADLLASESHIMLSHVLDNDPRVGYAHQTNLIGPATDTSGQDVGYTLLRLIDNMLSQYNSWYTSTAPITQMTDATEAQVLAKQAAWTSANTAGQTSATETNGVVTVTNNGAGVNVPVTVPAGTTVNNAAFGQSYGGSLSDWVNLGTGSTETLTENVLPTITSAASASSIASSPFSFTVTTTGAPAPALTETGALPAGITFTDNGNGTATIAGTAAADSGGSFPLQITAKNSVGGVTQSFTLTNSGAPSITSPGTASFSTGAAGTYTVSTTGYPAATITESGTLPSGLAFTDNKDGTASITGTPASGTEGTYPVTISATNSSGSTATLALTITVTTGAAPAITSGSTADFTLNSAGAAAITATGSPTAKITETGTLPAGLTFTDNGTGTALLSGTATATGTATLTITASNGISPDATQTYTVVVGDAPNFTSASSVTATAGSAFSFTATAGGYPAPSWGESSLPPGVTFTDNKDGTATLSGTPTTPGTYAIPLSAVNGYGTASQTLTITVAQAPAITSAASATFTEGTPGTSTVTTTGSPTAVITESGTLPSGVTLTDNGDGTATLAGTPAAGSKGSYPITITAANGGSPNATQSFTLTVNAAPTAPAITSGVPAAFTEGTQGTFPVTTTGSPTAAITESGALPSGVTLTDGGNGTATLAGTPAAGSKGSYPITITAANGVGSNATQSFTITVNPAPVAPTITSAGAATFAAGSAGTFSVTTTGIPAAALSATSSPALPSGVTFKDNGNGTATLAGTPPAGSQGTYRVTLTAKNATGTATQAFVLTVNSGLAITSAATATATSGTAFSFTMTTTGTPAPALTHVGTLPPGITFTANTNGTATLAGTPTAAAKGAYPLTITAKNATGTASQAFTLTVTNAPAFSSAAAVTETAGTAFTFTVATTGYPAAALKAGTLPGGVSFSDNGNGTGLLSGTTAITAGTYSVPVTATNSGGTASQTITLTVKAAGTVKVPTFTSAAAATAATGKAFSFTVTTVGSPTSYTTNVTHSGALPAGVSFTNSGKGTATLTGTPTAASAGTYPVTFTAANTGGTTTQSFVLTVTGAPAITSAATATATDGSGFSFTVKTTGAPAPALAEAGSLPQGVTWTDNGDGTATLAGTPGVDQGGVYKFTITATNSGGTASQAFTLTVDQAPAITSAATATVTHGKLYAFTFTSVGYPAASVTHTGSVPGLIYLNLGNGTATLIGIPTKAGTYVLTITAKNSIGSATQTFTLTVS
ncbi:MAG: putative Ig domain-containing protein [Streptosporangiaceae bacterium]